MGEDFPRKFRQLIMGRASSGVDRRGGRNKGKELVCRWREEQVGWINGGPDLLQNLLYTSPAPATFREHSYVS